MARSRAVALEVDPNAETANVPEEAGGDGSGSLFDASGDARVRVLRRDERTQKMVTHGFMPPTVSEEDVSQAFGGGHYRAQLFVPDDAGSTKVKRQRDFYLPGPYKPPARIHTMSEVGPNGPAATADAAAAATVGTMPAGGDDLMAVLKAGIINTLLDMMKTNKEVRAPGMDPMLLELMKAQAASQSQMMTMMMTLMTPLLTRGEGDSKKEILSTLAQMKDLVAPPVGVPGTDPMTMFNTMLETFTRMRDVAEDINPRHESGSGDPIMDSIPKLVEVVAEQHQMNKAQRAGQVTTTRTVPGPAGGTAQMPVVGTIGPNPPLAIWQQILRAHAARLLSAAAAKQNPDVIAGMAILFAPPNVKEALALFFHREPVAVKADILTEIPSMVDHGEWLDEFVEAAQEQLFPDEFADEDATDAGDAKDGDKSGR